MYRKTFKLKQHTPIIHFQHDQAGATLRATEVKPRLDKFIQELFVKLIPEDSVELLSSVRQLKENFTSKRRSLYRLRLIAPHEDPEKYLFVSAGMNSFQMNSLRSDLEEHCDFSATIVEKTGLFANEDKLLKGVAIDPNKKGDIRIGVLYPGKHTLMVDAYDKSVLKLICVALPYFFLSTNFGLRKTKGFGSFTVQNPVQAFEASHLTALFPAIFFKEFTADWMTTIQKVNSEYKKLKADTNDRSKIRDYFFDQDPKVYWERFYVNQKIVGGKKGVFLKSEGREASNKKKAISDKNIRYVRALLGLAQLHHYSQVETPEGKGVDVNIRDADDTSAGVLRYASPLLFKVTSAGIYLFASPVNSKMLGRKFQFFIGEDYESSTQKGELYTPESFDVLAFLKYSLNNDWNRL